MTIRTVTAADYERAFEAERHNDYPVVDALEKRLGYAVERAKLEQAAKVLACPVKEHGANWQHGRVLYALVRRYLADRAIPKVHAFDCGTAKGFSALMMLWACMDAPECQEWSVSSVDVLDPDERVRRNTVAEVSGYKTLHQILEPWPESRVIQFHKTTGQKWLTARPERIHVAFIDGKHSYDAVSWEVALLAERQQRGDLAIFDDVQIAGVRQALKDVTAYDFEYLDVKPGRIYAIGTRK